MEQCGDAGTGDHWTWRPVICGQQSGLPLLFHKDAMWCLLTLLCLTLWDPIDCSPPGSSVQGISQERILEWVATSFSRGSSQARDQTHISCIGRRILCHWATREALNMPWKVNVSCSVTSNSLRPTDCRLPGSSVYVILQARILEWVAISFSRGIFPTH